MLQSQLFKNANLISRDRAHRTRSITKGVWGPLNAKCDGLLGRFTTNEHSLSRMLKRFVRRPVINVTISLALIEITHLSVLQKGTEKPPSRTHSLESQGTRTSTPTSSKRFS